MIGLEDVRFLRSPAGAALLAAVDSLPDSLPLHTVLQRLKKQFPQAPVAAALEMQDLRRRAGDRFSRAGRMLFTREALEQASGEIVASHRARRFQDHGAVTDLCCSIGGDALALAARGEVIAVDRDPVRLECLRHNLEVYERADACTVIQGDVTKIPIETECAFIDPSRRTEGRRVRSGEEYSPPLSFVFDLATRVYGLGAKLSPSLHLPPLPGHNHNDPAVLAPITHVPSDPTTLSPYHPITLSPTWELEIISLDGVCREMVLWSGCLATVPRRATVLERSSPHSFDYSTATLTGDESDPEVPLRLPEAGDALLEPDPAVIRARLVGQLASTLNAFLIDPQIAYLVTPECGATPFASAYRVLEIFPFSRRRLQERLTALGVGHLTIKKRGFPLSPEQLQAQLRLRGDTPATVVLTRRGDEHLAMLVERV